jgi:surface antigen
MMAGCSAAPDAATENTEDVAATSEEAINSTCGHAPLASIDGIPAYAMCGYTPVYSDDGEHTRTYGGSGWIRTGGNYGYQCVELAERYEHFKYDVPVGWGGAYAKDMCADHPSDLHTTSSPVHGDLMVIKPYTCGIHFAGHVAVVNEVVSGNRVKVVQQNEYPANGEFAHDCALCYLHADRNNDCGDKADGAYCGDSTSLKGGKKGTLYHCKNHEISSHTTCDLGCNVVSGANDACKTEAPSTPGTQDGGSDKTDFGNGYENVLHHETDFDPKSWTADEPNPKLEEANP